MKQMPEPEQPPTDEEWADDNRVPLHDEHETIDYDPRDEDPFS